jgi:hypothetical protein
VIDTLPGTNFAQNEVFFVVQVRGNEAEDGLADDLARFIAKNAAGSLVPTADDAIEIFADNRVIGRSDDCSKEILYRFRG